MDYKKMSLSLPPLQPSGPDPTLIIALIVLGLVVYAAMRQMQKKNGDDDAPNAPKPPPPPPPTPPTKAEQAEQMKACKFRGAQHGTCTFDPSSAKVVLKCHDGYYGSGCMKRCITSGNKATKYTAGFEEGPSKATCECPSSYHFLNTDVSTGCEAGSAEGDHCEAGFHGQRCQLSGTYKDCMNGCTLDNSGKCSGNDAFQGSLCQFQADHCTSMDKGANLVGDKCQCSPGFGGAKCTEARVASCKNGGTKSADGKSCKCVPPFAGPECETRLDTCLPDSGPGCTADKAVCPNQSNGSGCDRCVKKGDSVCCSNNYTGCGWAQTTKCVDKNIGSYPCVTQVGNHYMKSGGVEMTAAEVSSYRT